MRQDHFEEAIKNNPDFSEAYNNMGIVYAKQGNKKKANALFSKALAMKPDYKHIRYNMESLME